MDLDLECDMLGQPYLSFTHSVCVCDSLGDRFIKEISIILLMKAHFYTFSSVHSVAVLLTWLHY